eukprot:evm.model.NODE_5707_length_2232_cov_24.621416.1
MAWGASVLRNDRREACCGGGADAWVEDADGERAKKRWRPEGTVVHAEEDMEEALVER